MKQYRHLLRKKNVISVGQGYKYRNGVRTDEVCIVVGVSKKVALESLKAEDLIPKTIESVSTDVIELGVIKAQIIPTSRLRPVQPGCSVGHYKITAGTCGCLVKKNNEYYILSNNHVLANSNEAKIGDVILQPGSYDGGSFADEVGTLHDFIKINFEGETDPTPTPDPDPNPPQPPEPPKENGCFILKMFAKNVNQAYSLLNRKSRLQVVTVEPQDLTNTVDCALAKPSTDIDKAIIDIGEPKGIAFAFLGQDLQKYGRTTKFTTGKVIQLNATVQVDYDGHIATFENQIITTPMSEGGDSGSVVLDNDKKLVGLLFAGSDTVTILNPIQEVFNKLQVSL